MASTSVTVNIDENLKTQVETLFEDMGLSMTTAFTIFAKAVVRQNKIPFEVAADPFYSQTNQIRLKESIEEFESGNATFIVKTMAELEAMANE